MDFFQTMYISVQSEDGSSNVHKVRFFVSGVEVMHLIASNSFGLLGLGITTALILLAVMGTHASPVPVGNSGKICKSRGCLEGCAGKIM